MLAFTLLLLFIAAFFGSIIQCANKFINHEQDKAINWLILATAVFSVTNVFWAAQVYKLLMK